MRHSKVYSLTPAGRDTARQLHLNTGEKGAEADDPSSLILKLLDGRPLSASYINQKVKNAASALRSLTKKAFAPGTAFTAADGGPFVGTVDLTTGIVTPIVTGLGNPGGMVFVDTSKHSADDSRASEGNHCGDRDSDSN